MAFTRADLEHIDRIIAEGDRRIERFRRHLEASRAAGTATWIAEETLEALIVTQTIAIQRRALVLKALQSQPVP